jgi:hypothetical protein
VQIICIAEAAANRLEDADAEQESERQRLVGVTHDRTALATAVRTLKDLAARYRVPVNLDARIESLEQDLAAWIDDESEPRLVLRGEGQPVRADLDECARIALAIHAAGEAPSLSQAARLISELVDAIWTKRGLPQAFRRALWGSLHEVVPDRTIELAEKIRKRAQALKALSKN